MAEDGNHLAWDLSLLEDKSKIRTGCEPANNATLNDLEPALIKRSGKFAAVPQRMAHYTANRETALEALLTRQKGDPAHAAGQPSGPGAVWSGMGEICLRDCPGRAGRRMRPASFRRDPRRRRDRIRPTLRLIQAVRWGTRNPSESQMNLR